MPHDGHDYEVKLTNIAEGRRGGGFRIFDALFKGTLNDNEPLGLFASAEDGVASMIIGAYANESARTGMPVTVKRF